MSLDETPTGVYIDDEVIQEGLQRYAKRRIALAADELGVDPFGRDVIAKHLSLAFMEGVRFGVIEWHARQLEAGYTLPPLEVDVHGLDGPT